MRACYTDRLLNRVFFLCFPCAFGGIRIFEFFNILVCQASEVYAEMKKKVLVKHERQGLEGQLCSLLRIAGDAMSPKVRNNWERLAAAATVTCTRPCIPDSLFCVAVSRGLCPYMCMTDKGEV